MLFPSAMFAPILSYIIFIGTSFENFNDFVSFVNDCKAKYLLSFVKMNFKELFQGFGCKKHN